MSDPSSFPLSTARFVTPDQKYVVDNTPHTPTPFKNALEKYGPIRPLVSVGQVWWQQHDEHKRDMEELKQSCEPAVICASTAQSGSAMLRWEG